ncbi:hypothetical protein BKA70DRAFT_1423144 [Coprinopsis sp. MPI-PUGE-AT-0042]|nr:hypothetical protein BKA70DRAFT_1423144 [Coprinopsis sp. MPI-PUGE-AT-0042]
MSWKVFFSTGMRSLREGDLEVAVDYFSKALDAKPDNMCLVYDARSSALAKLGKHRDALKDVRKTIELAPEQWQGYLRAARLFHHLRKHSNAMVMVDIALDKCPESLPKRSEIEALKIKIRTAQVEHIRRTQNHSAILPIELFTEIVHMLIDDDPASLLQVSHVCRHWQSVVGANSLFWRTLVSRPKSTTYQSKTLGITVSR